MIASNNPIDIEPVQRIIRLPAVLAVDNTFPLLKNTIDVINVSTALITLSFSINRVFVTFSASIPTGTVSVTTGSDIVTGANSDFVNELVVGDAVTINDEQFIVVEIISSTSFRVDRPVEGASASGIFLVKSARPTQTLSLAITINGTDVSSNVVGTLSVDWPDDGGGTCRFQLVGQNPFSSGAPANIDELVDVKVTFTDEANNAFTARIFKGKIVDFDYNPDNDILDVEVQDLSRDVSHETDKLNQEIQNVDPVVTETLTASTDRLVTSKVMDVTTDNPIFGIWTEGDALRNNNIAEQTDFTIASDNRTIDFLQSGKVNAGQNYVIRYAIPESSFTRVTRRKSEIIETIANLAGITSLINERKGAVEDEVVEVNIVANQEFPLDIIRKIVLAQTWKVEYTENGDLLIRREQLKSTPDITFNEASIVENTLSISKSIDTVINEQRVSGVIKRLTS